MLDSITPLILTYNEAPNIERTLSKLKWAKDIVVVDSNSDDDTIFIASHHPTVRVFKRAFDSHANQWNYALRETGITSEWVLALDADYVLSDELVNELEVMNPEENIDGYQATFRYCVHGNALRGTVYPPVTVLYRFKHSLYQQDGHTQRIVVRGKLATLKYPVFHDDRKPLKHWISAQQRYMRLESEKLLASNIGELCWTDRLRLMRFVFPFLIFFYCLLIKGLILDGRAGLYYSMQRLFAELLLSLNLLQNDITHLRGLKVPEE
jgi:glycosyltransferase involved in cell wall biosynthesis